MCRVSCVYGQAVAQGGRLISECQRCQASLDESSGNKQALQSVPVLNFYELKACPKIMTEWLNDVRSTYLHLKMLTWTPCLPGVVAQAFINSSSWEAGVLPVQKQNWKNPRPGTDYFFHFIVLILNSVYLWVASMRAVPVSELKLARHWHYNSCESNQSLPLFNKWNPSLSTSFSEWRPCVFPLCWARERARTLVHDGQGNLAFGACKS